MSLDKALYLRIRYLGQSKVIVPDFVKFKFAGTLRLLSIALQVDTPLLLQKLLDTGTLRCLERIILVLADPNDHQRPRLPGTFSFQEPIVVLSPFEKWFRIVKKTCKGFENKSLVVELKQGTRGGEYIDPRKRLDPIPEGWLD